MLGRTIVRQARNGSRRPAPNQPPARQFPPATKTDGVMHGCVVVFAVAFLIFAAIVATRLGLKW
jgi:hypothetical protein